MPVFALTNEIAFPHPSLATPQGLLAVGGDLSPERLLLAYRMGIFPWYNEGDPILWWSPSPRLILYPADIHASRSLLRSIRRESFSVTFDQDFGGVIRACAAARRRDEGTWLLPEMIEAYERLHHMGYAHSVETRKDGELSGGLYGISLGRCFFGESMFFCRPDASKTALVALAAFLSSRGFSFIDCQQNTAHLRRMGARPVSRRRFLELLNEAVKAPTLKGNWGRMEG